MRRELAIAALFALAGCTPPPPAVMAETPSMVSICASQRAPFNATVAAAQRSCAQNGKSATLLHRDACGDPLVDARTVAWHFRCE